MLLFVEFAFWIVMLPKLDSVYPLATPFRVNVPFATGIENVPSDSVLAPIIFFVDDSSAQTHPSATCSPESKVEFELASA